MEYPTVAYSLEGTIGPIDPQHADTPFVSRNGTDGLSSQEFIAGQDAHNNAYIVKFGWIYSSALDSENPNGPCGTSYNRGFMEPFIYIKSRLYPSGQTWCAPTFGVFPNAPYTFRMEYTGGTPTRFYVGRAGTQPAFLTELQTGIGEYGFDELQVGGFSSVTNSNPNDNQDKAVWIGGLGYNRRVVFTNMQFKTAYNTPWLPWNPDTVLATGKLVQCSKRDVSQPCPYTMDSTWITLPDGEEALQAYNWTYTDYEIAALENR